jgi:hypothetical protein
MRLIFLDIDGVLNDHRLQDNGYCGLKPSCVANFNLLLAELPDLQIVITSAWRYMVLNKAMTLKGFEYMLLVGGVNCEGRIHGHTRSDEEILTRGLQILNYLGRLCWFPKKYIVLDDMLFDFDKQGLNYYLTEGNVGLTEANVREIIKIF